MSLFTFHISSGPQTTPVRNLHGLQNPWPASSDNRRPYDADFITHLVTKEGEAFDNLRTATVLYYFRGRRAGRSRVHTSI
jgi:hypothetical protein